MTDEEFRVWRWSDEGRAAADDLARDGLIFIYPSVARMLNEIVNGIEPKRVKSK